MFRAEIEPIRRAVARRGRRAEEGEIKTRRQRDFGAFGAAYLAAIVESSDDGIIGKDLSGVIRSWNRGAGVIFGYSAAEVVGRPIQVLFPPERRGEEDMILSRIRGGERVDHYETIRRRKDGSDFPVSVTISPIRDEDGTIVGASKIIRDISEQRRAQEELVQAKRELERVVIEKTGALAERELLLREVHHRVKNNLQVIDAMLMLQALKTGDPQVREALLGMRGRVCALGLVHQQLMGSADLKTFDIAAFLRDLSANIMGGVADDRIKLTVDAAPLEVGADVAAPLGLITTELVTNSLKHAFPDGVGEVSVVLRPDTAGRILLVVSDNGRGLSTGEPAAPGASLGLSLVQRLVEQIQGEMVVRRGAGTTTEISIPLQAVA